MKHKNKLNLVIKRKLMILAIILFSGCPALLHADDTPLDSLFNYLKTWRNKTLYFAYISPVMLELFDQSEADSVDSSQVTADEAIKGERTKETIIDKIRVVSITNTEEYSNSAASLYYNINKFIEQYKFEDLMEINDNREKLRFAIRKQGQMIKQFIMLSWEGEKAVFVYISGDIYLRDLTSLAAKTKISKLKKIKKAEIYNGQNN